LDAKPTCGEAALDASTAYPAPQGHPPGAEGAVGGRGAISVSYIDSKKYPAKIGILSSLQGWIDAHCCIQGAANGLGNGERRPMQSLLNGSGERASIIPFRPLPVAAARTCVRSVLDGFLAQHSDTAISLRAKSISNEETREMCLSISKRFLRSAIFWALLYAPIDLISVAQADTFNLRQLARPEWTRLVECFAAMMTVADHHRIANLPVEILEASCAGEISFFKGGLRKAWPKGVKLNDERYFEERVQELRAKGFTQLAQALILKILCQHECMKSPTVGPIMLLSELETNAVETYRARPISFCKGSLCSTAIEDVSLDKIQARSLNEPNRGNSSACFNNPVNKQNTQRGCP
jgi:hypothetical protein